VSIAVAAWVLLIWQLAAMRSIRSALFIFSPGRFHGPPAYTEEKILGAR
jgi:hypothetical protein